MSEQVYEKQGPRETVECLVLLRRRAVNLLPFHLVKLLLVDRRVDKKDFSTKKHCSSIEEATDTNTKSHLSNFLHRLQLKARITSKMADGVPVIANNDADFERKLKCVFLGDSNTGKTCLLLQLCYSSNNLSRKQVESFTSAYLANIDVNGKIYQLELWDTESQREKGNIEADEVSRNRCILPVFFCS